MIKTFARAVRPALAALVVVSAIPVAAWAQGEPYPWKNVPRTADGKVDLNAPARRMPDGKPDLSGFWMPEHPVKHPLTPAADCKPEDAPLHPGARALYNERIENNGKDHPGVR